MSIPGAQATQGKETSQNEPVRRRESMFAPSSDSNPMARSQSPASTIFSSSLPGKHLTDSSIRASRGLAPRKPILKTDFTITTNFDPADAELYALWAPCSK